MGNPPCPEPHCHYMLRLKRHSTDLGLSPCPFCKSEHSKPYILTPKKEGLRKCMHCRKDFTPKRRQGYGKFYVCPEHYWQRFAVGETILRKDKPRTAEEIKTEMGIKKPFQAKPQRKNPNIQLRQA